MSGADIDFFECLLAFSTNECLKFFFSLRDQFFDARRVNTAVSDGYQTVIDYWPDSPEAIAAAYYIGRCCKDTGELKKAKKGS
mgnify:CR=1 FL=1